MKDNTIDDYKLNHNIKLYSNQDNKKLDLLLSFVFYRSLQGEIWREIKGYNGNYFISNKGRVLSLCRNGYKLMKQFNCQDYKYVDLCVNGQKHHNRVNRLVAQAFIDNPDNKPIVHHKDNQKQNNLVENLVYQTYKEHAQTHKKKDNKDKE